jgi:cullin-associated NEDD8-dissociated protein 1
LRCPTEITPYVAPIIQAGTQFIKYDPVCFRFSVPILVLSALQNYAGDDDEDEEMADADDDDEEAELDEWVILLRSPHFPDLYPQIFR